MPGQFEVHLRLTGMKKSDRIHCPSVQPNLVAEEPFLETADKNLPPTETNQLSSGLQGGQNERRVVFFGLLAAFWV